MEIQELIKWLNTQIKGEVEITFVQQVNEDTLRVGYLLPYSNFSYTFEHKAIPAVTFVRELNSDINSNLESMIEHLEYQLDKIHIKWTELY